LQFKEEDIMPSMARENYLTTTVFTAPPQRLRLMLIEEALRSCHRAREAWLAGEDNQASEAIIHAEDVLGELLSGLQLEAGSELARNIAAIYAFILAALMEAGLRRDEKKLADAVRVLTIEQETWRLVCEKLAADTTTHNDTTEEESRFPLPHGPHAAFAPYSTMEAGLSLEA
jgi:flagellar secretion chaperone FliS